MINFKINPAWLLTALLTAIIVFLLATKGCGDDVLTDVVTITVHDTIPGDPYPVSERVPVPYPVYIDTGSVQWRTMPIDTMAILADYFSSYCYEQVLKDDTSAYISVSDTIRQNKIAGRSFTFQNRRPIAVTTHTVTINTKDGSWVKLYMGLNAAYSPSTKRFGIGPFATATIRPGGVLTYGYDIAGNSHQLGFGWKLRLKK